MKNDVQGHFKFAEWRVIDTVNFRSGAPVASGDDPAHVEDPRWSAVIPLLHRALANPTGNVVLPEMPRRFGMPDEAACAYWEAPLYMMRALLGWERPGLGMLWVHQNQRLAHSDLRLELLEACWNNQQQLDLLTAHLWRVEHRLQNLHEDEGGGSELNGVGPTANWWPLFHRRFPNPGFCNPYFGGENPLHLGHTRRAVRNTEGATYEWWEDRSTKRATLTVHRMRGWLGLLEAVTEDQLHDSDEPWRVNVVSKPVGWLGSFTKSPATGKWHASTEEVHRAGNPPEVARP